MQPLDDDLDPRTALAMGAQDHEEELAILEDHHLQARQSSKSSGQKSVPRSSGSRGPAEIAATPVGDDAPPKIQVGDSVGEDEPTCNRNTLLSINASKAGDVPERAMAPPVVKSQGSGLRTQKTRQSGVLGALGESALSALNGENLEDMTIARRLSKERAAVLTPASRRVLNKMKRRQQTDENGDVVEAPASPFMKALRRVVGHPGFDLGCAAVIIANSALIGLEVDWKTFSDGEMPHMKALNYVCTVFFFVELMLRMTIDGLFVFFMRSENRSWNMFDAVLVGMSLLDAVIIDLIDMGDDATGVSGGLKTLKMLRIVRVCRVFRFFTELSQLALMIIDSVKSLMWALIMLFIVIYVFGIFFIHGVTDRLRSIRTGTLTVPEQDAVVIAHFGNLPTVLQTLFQSMLNGISWYTLTDALETVHPTLVVLFLFYIAFSMLAVLNIITGVFVDNAVETARTQREYLVQKEMELKEKWCQEMRKLFNEMDADGSGTLSLSEVKEFFNDDRVRSYFIALGLETQDAERLFLLLDEEETGDIDIDMFLNGCLRLKGTARSIDVYQLLQDYRKMNNRLLDLQETVGNAVKAPNIRVSTIANGAQASKGGGSKSNSETQKGDSRGGSIIVKQAG
jgi:Ca2+-binding EF-hand superfamily protein